ncbi:ABC transporter permease [uncultured Jatrophihabitans sp.]|uniref:ABC transporter permease n=1 Tax=uncultured Jatrophihabitans sp. TaxID=1610747 RepID=UPI0035CBDBF3
MTTLSARPSALPTAARRRRSLRPPAKFLCGLGAVVVAIAAWEIVALAGVEPKIVLPGPLDVLRALRDVLTSDTIGVDLRTSGEELLSGLLLGVVVGLPIGLLVGWYRYVSYVLNPFINFLYATPRIALTPLLIIWFGIGNTSKVAIVFLMAVFPIIINTAAGVQSIDESVRKVARCYGASDLQTFRTVALPGTVPFIISGLRLAVGQALIGVFVSELSGAQHGVGLLMNTAGQQFQTSVVFAGLIIFAVTGVVLTGILRRIERHFAAWRPASH